MACYLRYRKDLKECVGTEGGLGRYAMPGELCSAYAMTYFINRHPGLMGAKSFAWFVCVDRDHDSEDVLAAKEVDTAKDETVKTLKVVDAKEVEVEEHVYEVNRSRKVRMSRSCLRAEVTKRDEATALAIRDAFDVKKSQPDPKAFPRVTWAEILAATEERTVIESKGIVDGVILTSSPSIVAVR